MTGNEDNIAQQELIGVLHNAVQYVTSEAPLLAQYELVHKGVFHNLWPTSDTKAFNEHVDRVVEHLGGPPRFYVLKVDDEPPPADTYPEAAMGEVVDMFWLARKSVMRAHMFKTGSTLLAESPALMGLFEDDTELTSAVTKHAESAFWEHAEAAYIRLYSYWDRVGQVLDFAFFNIRKFDHNGFDSVMKRIHANVRPMNNQMEASEGWTRLRAFQTSAKEDGLKWLLERRNLIVHSLHLHPVLDKDENMFKAQFNHLEDAHRERLRPRDPEEEVTLLLRQLRRASDLFKDFLAVAEFAPSRKCR